MDIFAKSDFRPGNLAAIQDQITARAIAAMTKGVEGIRDLAKEKCPVRTGELQASIVSVVIFEGQLVTGRVQTDTPYAAYVEFGVRQLGAAGQWAGPYPYSPGKGFAGFGFMRGALDESHDDLLNAFRSEGFRL